MKKTIFFLVVLFASIASINAETPEFFRIYNQAKELNRPIYPDFHKIPIGAPVVFPDYDNEGVIYFSARTPKNGRHDCIWYLAKDYQNLKADYQNPDLTKNDDQKKVPDIVINPDTDNNPDPVEKNSDSWVWWLFLGLILLLVVSYLLNKYRPWNNRKNLDKNPAISGGLSNNPAEAATQISALTGSRVVKSEKGRLICNSPAKAIMKFSDGEKKIKIISGEEYYKITEANRIVRYARLSCGNLIAGSISQLPEGVTFIPSTEENSTWSDKGIESKKNDETTADANANINETTIDTQEKLPTENKFFQEEKVSDILSALDKMGNNPPSKMSLENGNLVIEFFPHKEKNEKAKDK